VRKQALRWLFAWAVMASLVWNGLSPLARAADQTTTFKVPPVRIPMNLKDQRVTMIASALLTLTTKSHGLNVLSLQLTADLADLQRNITGVLADQLDKNDPCADRITIQNATLTPTEPASVAVVQLHYERWGCAKIFGKQQAKRLVSGNAVIQMTLTPAIEQDHTQLKLVAEVGPIQADGSLGELLRSGTLGDLLREKIRNAILSAMQKGTDLAATLPPAVQGYAKIKDARFKDGGNRRLLVLLDGEVQITNDQIQALAKQVKERVSAETGK
jgi:hypothetical protein